MREVTRILSAIDQGDPHAAEHLLPLIYDELRRLAAERMAREKPGQTLQATALVHEAYLRLVDVDKAQHWDSRGHFFAAAAEAMRRILVENARRRKREKHGGQIERVPIEGLGVASKSTPDELLGIDETLENLADRMRRPPNWSSFTASGVYRSNRPPKCSASPPEPHIAIGLTRGHGSSSAWSVTLGTLPVENPSGILAVAPAKNRIEW